MTSSEKAIIKSRQVSAPIDITAIATALGLSVYDDTPLDNGVSGMIIREQSPDNPSGYRININPRDSYRRQRFTIAHECAHYLLHREKIGDGITDNAMYRSDVMTSAEEFEANNLAADLIMPRNLVLQHYKQGTETYSEMADLFDVSVPAMRVRLRYLLYLP
jgi:Zn-dependent peptidase ImmA (M78 family)